MTFPSNNYNYHVVSYVLANIG